VFFFFFFFFFFVAVLSFSTRGECLIIFFYRATLWVSGVGR